MQDFLDMLYGYDHILSLYLLHNLSRFDEIGIFSMTETGLITVSEPSAIFLTRRNEALQLHGAGLGRGQNERPLRQAHPAGGVRAEAPAGSLLQKAFVRRNCRAVQAGVHGLCTRFPVPAVGGAVDVSAVRGAGEPSGRSGNAAAV